eukprot:SM000043S15776  [mRNA]  locus=s43:10209:18109:+ [translate_table: standard]
MEGPGPSGGVPVVLGPSAPLVRHGTSPEVALATAAAAAAVRLPPSIVVSAKAAPASPGRGWRRSIARVWRTPAGRRDRRPDFNPEVLTRQKREWSQLQKMARDRSSGLEEAERLFEHFVVVGLPPDTDLQPVEAAFAGQRRSERARERAERARDDNSLSRQYRGPSGPSLKPQILFKYPPGRRLALKDLPLFCFPAGVQARVVERTPSMSDLNDVLYGQAHQKRDDQAFVFRLKVANNTTLYGICVHVQEVVQRSPGVLAASPPPLSSPPAAATGGRLLTSAPRCYCFLTRLPLFDLHFEVLYSIVAQERLARIRQCVAELASLDELPQLRPGPPSPEAAATPLVRRWSHWTTAGTANSTSGSDGGTPDDGGVADGDDGSGWSWMEDAIPARAVLGTAAAGATLLPESFPASAAVAMAPTDGVTGFTEPSHEAEGGASGESGGGRSGPHPEMTSDICGSNDAAVEVVAEVEAAAPAAETVELIPSVNEVEQGGGVSGENELVGTRGEAADEGRGCRQREEASASGKEGEEGRRREERAACEGPDDAGGVEELGATEVGGAGREVELDKKLEQREEERQTREEPSLVAGEEEEGGGTAGDPITRLVSEPSLTPYLQTEVVEAAESHGIATSPEEAAATSGAASNPYRAGLDGGALVHRLASSDSLHSLEVASSLSFDSEPESLDSLGLEDDYGAAAISALAEATGNEALQVVCAFGRAAVPPPGGVATFQPLEHVPPVATWRFPAARMASYTSPRASPAASPPASPLRPLSPHLPSPDSLEALHQVPPALRLSEEAASLAVWAIAAACRALSLDNVHLPLFPSLSPPYLLLYAHLLASFGLPPSRTRMANLAQTADFAPANILGPVGSAAVGHLMHRCPWQVLAMLLGALLERQMVVICPNLGILTAVVLALIPMLQPYFWQSVLLPILPADLLDFLDAPVPFIVGVQHKTAEVRAKTANLLRVNVYKNKVKMSVSLPPLPKHAELLQKLQPFHARLMAAPDAHRRPIYRTTTAQVRDAEGFLGVLGSYLESLCTDLRTHSITDVQDNNDKVSLLLKDSFVDSFTPKDRPFIKLFVETQLFSVHCDTVLCTTSSP